MAYFDYYGKNIFYQILGNGQPVVFLHGNTASSRMFELLAPLYTSHCQMILLDFLGNGRSDRITTFPANLWQQQAQQVINLLEHLHCRAALVGTSGGAWAALNAALKRPDLIRCVIADSFDGRTLHPTFTEDLLTERATAKQDPQARQFYQWCQGADWKTVIDCDTKALIQCAQQQLPLFCKPLTEIQVPILLLGSKADTMVRTNLAEEYQQMAAEMPYADIHLFDNGSHPAIFSNAEEAAQIICTFLKTHAQN